jgi:UDP-glucose 4-epimerase
MYVTGAAGFIGSHTARTLANCGCRVVGIDQRPYAHSELENNVFMQFVESPCTLDALEHISSRHGLPSAIVHCAGSASVPGSFNDPRADFVSNVSTTIEVLEYARRNDNVRIVVPTSAAVYGAARDLPLREEAALQPISPYGVHKLLVEQVCRSYGNSFGIPVVCIRLFSVYGIGLRKQLLWDACEKAAARKYEFFGTGDELRDWFHVLDAARLLMVAISWASAKCPVFNGGTGMGLSIREILTRLGTNWRPSLSPVFSGQERVGDPVHLVADTSRIIQMGFNAQIDLNQAIADYVAWYQKECRV